MHGFKFFFQFLQNQAHYYKLAAQYRMQVTKNHTNIVLEEYYSSSCLS